MTIKEIADASKWRLVSSSIVPDPKTAVKELIDNAIDAGATSIYIDIDSISSGCHYICVRDNGRGVDKADRDAMCLNHTTSKINSLSDLSRVNSLGFRGQALFSLATLANKRGSMEITTKREFESVGERWVVPQDGLIRERKKVSCPSGTTVLIKNLLLGLRARYLSTVARASRSNEEIHRLVYHYSLIFRSIRFHFSLVTIDKSGSVTKKQLQESLEPNLSRVRALSIASRLRSPATDNFLVNENLPVSKFIHLDVILPKMQPQTEICGLRKNKRFLSVNNRVISLHLSLGSLIVKLLGKVYRGANLMEPTTWYINLECDARILDLNVEPAKDDVMIKDISSLMSQMEDALSSYLTSELKGDERQDEAEITEMISKVPELSKAPILTTQNTLVKKPCAGISPNCADGYVKSNVDIEEEESAETIQAAINPTTPRQNKHEAISDLRATQWKRNLNSDDPVSTQESVNSCPSSTESSPGALHENEDLTLGRNVALSNPFMTAKLKQFNVKQRKIEVVQRTLDSRTTSSFRETNLFEPRISLRAKATQPSSSSTCNDTTLVDERATGERAIASRLPLASEKLHMKSEHTEGCAQLLIYKKGRYDQNSYKEELQWLARDPDPANRVADSLLAFSKDFKNRKISLSRAEQGWYVLTI